MRRSQGGSQPRMPWAVLIFSALVVLSLWFMLAPPRFWINIIKRVDLSEPVRTGEVLLNRYGCRNCHQVGGYGGFIAPSLDGVTTRLSEDELRAWLRDPEAVQGPTAMPDFSLSDSEIEAILAYFADNDSVR